MSAAPSRPPPWSRCLARGSGDIRSDQRRRADAPSAHHFPTDDHREPTRHITATAARAPECVPDGRSGARSAHHDQCARRPTQYPQSPAEAPDAYPDSHPDSNHPPADQRPPAADTRLPRLPSRPAKRLSLGIPLVRGGTVSAATRMAHRSRRRAGLVTTAAVVLSGITAGCTGVHSPPSVTSAAPASTGPRRITEPSSPTIDPAAFSTRIDNPFLPMTPGTRTIYQAVSDEGRQQTVTEVTRETKKIMGVGTVVVHDTVSLEGNTMEDSLDWFAQDRDGNVWYFGEATKKFENGTVDTAGSFEAGVNGALPGIVMLGTPQIAINTGRNSPRVSPRTPARCSVFRVPRPRH